MITCAYGDVRNISVLSARVATTRHKMQTPSHETDLYTKVTISSDSTDVVKAKARQDPRWPIGCEYSGPHLAHAVFARLPF